MSVKLSLLKQMIKSGPVLMKEYGLNSAKLFSLGDKQQREFKIWFTSDRTHIILTWLKRFC
jgi:hypothetical protein